MIGTRGRAYVHVGCPKTGTTYLQSVLWASEAALGDQGVTLPLGGVNDHFRVALALRNLLDPAFDPPTTFRALDQLGAAIAGTSSSHVLISHEVLAPATPAQAAELLDVLTGYEVHVIITARDLARQIPSGWQQRVKQRAVTSYEDFVEAVLARTEPARDFWLNQDVAQVAASWGSGVPAERVHLVTLPPPAASSGTLLERFSSVIGVDPASLNVAKARSNPPLGAAQAELLRRVNVALGDRLPHPRAGYARSAKVYLANQVLAAQGGKPQELTGDQLRRARDISADMIARLDGVGYDVVGDLGELLPPEMVRLEASDSAVGEEMVSASAVETIATMLTQRQHDVERLQLLRAKLRRINAGRPPDDGPPAAGRAAPTVRR